MPDNEGPRTLNPRDFGDQSPNPDIDAELALLCDLLQERGISSVLFRYCGSGDSGCVEEVEYVPEDRRLPGRIEDKLMQLAEGYCPNGYENEVGGYGTLVVHPFLGLAERQHYDRYEESEAMLVEPALLPASLQHRLSGIGVTCITAAFNGYRDSGDIEDFRADPDGIAIDELLLAEIEEFLINQLPAGWKINEGSFGHFEVDVQTRRVGVTAYWRTQRDSDAQVTRWRWRQ